MRISLQKSGTTYDPFFPQITYLCTEVNVKSISATMNVSDILYKKLKIKTDESCPPTEEMLAVITHWMHNAGKASASPYGEKCRKYLQTILCASDPSLDKKDITLKSIKEQGLFQDAVNVPFPSPERSRFTFIDLFAGMGGFRLSQALPEQRTRPFRSARGSPRWAVEVLSPTLSPQDAPCGAGRERPE